MGKMKHREITETDITSEYNSTHFVEKKIPKTWDILNVRTLKVKIWGS